MPQKPSGKDDDYPLGFRTWTFINFKTGRTQDVTGEYIGSALESSFKAVKKERG